MAGARITRQVGIHIAAWAAFIGYEVTIARLWDSTSPYYEFAGFYLLDVLLFYGNAQLVSVSNTARPIKLFGFVLVILIELTLFSSVSLAVGVLMYKIENNWAFYSITNKDCAQAIWRGVYIIGLSTGYGFFKRQIRLVKERNTMQLIQLETERKMIASQNAYLRAQINPHLLFNTLNFVYSSVVRVAPEAGKNILLLSDTMHYALDERADGKVALTEEIEQIERYIELNRLRFNQRLRLSLTKDLDSCNTDEILLPPLILLTFIENMFKHGDLTSYPNDAIVIICCRQNRLHINTRNYKKGWVLPGSRPHIGISNVRMRLESFYSKDNFNLALNETDTEFIVDLTIQL